jgi:hypothetical protein
MPLLRIIQCHQLPARWQKSMNDNNVTILTYKLTALPSSGTTDSGDERTGVATDEHQGWQQRTPGTSQTTVQTMGIFYFYSTAVSTSSQGKMYLVILYIVNYDLNTVATEEQPGFLVFMLSGCLQPGNTRKPLKTRKHTLVFSWCGEVWGKFILSSTQNFGCSVASVQLSDFVRNSNSDFSSYRVLP